MTKVEGYGVKEQGKEQQTEGSKQIITLRRRTTKEKYFDVTIIST
jgi:hypothetical protein